MANMAGHTRRGSEAVSRLFQAAAEAHSRATILSVDAVGALDHVSRQATLGALAAPALQPLPPCARHFSYTWYDDVGSRATYARFACP